MGKFPLLFAVLILLSVFASAQTKKVVTGNVTTQRDNRSITKNNQPLLVVNGAIYYSYISTLDTEDIADAKVMKGFSAEAIYGSDASKGVIIVTTKKVSREKPRLTFSPTTQAKKVSYMPTFSDKRQ